MQIRIVSTFPGSTIPRLLLSEKPGDPIFIYQRFPEDKTPVGRSFTTLDPKTGAVLSVGSTRTAPVLQTALVQWTREIHTGTILGLPTQIAAAFFALLLSVPASSKRNAASWMRHDSQDPAAFCSRRRVLIRIAIF
jgi:uncharacterized iron-regulated membrane protein